VSTFVVRPRFLAYADCTIVTVGLLAIIIGTSGEIATNWLTSIKALVYIASLMFAVEFYVRLQSMRTERGSPNESWSSFLFNQLRSAVIIIDIISILSVPVPIVIGFDERISLLFGLFWVFKYGRYSTGLMLLGRVIRNAADSLLSVLLGFVIILIGAATIMYLIEGANQPDQFGSIPLAMWWAIVTLTTTGYGDIVPLTVFGRLIAGGVKNKQKKKR